MAKGKFSASAHVILQLAALEAAQLRAPEIEPIHLLLGLAKSVDLDLPEVLDKAERGYNDTLEELLREVRRIRTAFGNAHTDPKALRRRLRKAVPKGRIAPAAGEQLHRSERTKQVFHHADQLAEMSGGVLYPVHLMLAVLLESDEQRDGVLADLRVSGARLTRAASLEAGFERQQRRRGSGRFFEN